MTSPFLKNAALQHYHKLVDSLPEVEVRGGRIGCGLFAEQGVASGSLLTEYMGTRMAHGETAVLNEMRARVGLTEQLQFSVEGTDIVSDASEHDHDRKYVNHSCSLNARYVMM